MAWTRLASDLSKNSWLDGLYEVLWIVTCACKPACLAWLIASAAHSHRPAPHISMYRTYSADVSPTGRVALLLTRKSSECTLGLVEYVAEPAFELTDYMTKHEGLSLHSSNTSSAIDVTYCVQTTAAPEGSNMITMLDLCGHESFGPVVKDSCPGGTDLTVLFQEAVLSAGPSLVLLMLVFLRMLGTHSVRWWPSRKMTTWKYLIKQVRSPARNKVTCTLTALIREFTYAT